MLERDLVDGGMMRIGGGIGALGQGGGEWRDLCGYWGGVRYVVFFLEMEPGISVLGWSAELWTGNCDLVSRGV